MKSVEIIMLPVKDRQKAKEFYLKLGFQVIVEAPDAHGETWIQLDFQIVAQVYPLLVFKALFAKRIISKKRSKN